MRFRKKPVEVDAILFTGENAEEVVDWATSFDDSEKASCPIVYQGTACTAHTAGQELVIATLEGVMVGRAGDWIIRGLKGEFYPCKPDIFAATYEPCSGRGSPVVCSLAERVYRLEKALQPYVREHAKAFGSLCCECSYCKEARALLEEKG